MKYVQKKLEKVQQLKYAVLEKMVGGDEELENLEEWSNQLEEKVSSYDDLMDKLIDESQATTEKDRTATGDVLQKKLLLKISQILQESTCVGISF